MEIEDFETVHLARELAREKGWDHVMDTIRRALRDEAVAGDGQGGGRPDGSRPRNS